MSTEIYMEMYYNLVIERRIDSDEVKCLLSDLEDELDKEVNVDAWDLLDEMIGSY